MLLTLEEIQKKIDDIFGTGLITIAPDQVYTGIRNKMLFIDRDYGNWVTAPFNIIQNKNTHPERSRERRKQTNLAKYGHENPFGSDRIKEKIKKINLERYGTENPMELDSVKDKLKQTNIERFGCATPIVGNKEVIEKVKKTNLERYGAENPAHSEELQQKKVQTNLERYGCESPFQNEDVKEKIRATNLERLGVEYPTQSPEVREKVKDTFRQNYGCDHPLQNSEIKEKLRKNNLEKYGVESVRQIDSPVLPNGLLLSQYLKQFNCSLWPTSCMNVYKKYSFDVLREYVEFGRAFGKDTALEKAVALALNLVPYKKSLKDPRRYPDFHIKDAIYLDIDGLYWHSDPVKKDKNYHFNKRLDYENKNFRLIQIREDEFIKRPKVVNSIVNNVRGLSKKINARSCQIKDISWKDAEEFLDQNHLQGVGAKSHCHGLFLNDILVMLICIRTNKDGLEISRLCTLVDHQVVGGFSKLLSYVEKEYNPKAIISWCDLRYATGKGYEAVGFKKVKETLGWRWTDFYKTYNRRTCRANMNERKLSEKEYACEFGLVRIYDAGQRLYMKTIY